MLAHLRNEYKRFPAAFSVFGRTHGGTTSVLAASMLALLLSGCTFDERRTRAKYMAVANARYARGAYTQALAVYDLVLRDDPKNGEAYFHAGLAAVRLQNWGDAIRYLQRAIELEPNRLEAYTELSNVYLFVYSNANGSVRAGLRQELSWLADELHKRFSGGYDDHRLQGYLALLGNDKKSALENFRKAHELKPQAADLTVVYFETLLWADQIQQAESLAAHTGRDDAGLARIYDTLVAHYARTNQLAEVERILREELEKNPNVAEAHLEMAALRFNGGRVGEMNAILKQLANDKSRFPVGALQAGDFFLRIRDFANAQDCYQRGINNADSFKLAYQKRMVEVLQKQSKVSEAQRLAAELNSTSRDPETRAIAASLKVLGGDKSQLQSAISEFQSLMGGISFDFVLKYLCGRAQILSGDIKGGTHLMQESIDLRPDYFWPRVALAQVMIDERNYGEMILIAKGLVANEGLDVPFDTAGQRPQERPVYEFLLGVRPAGAAALNDLAARMAETGLGLEEALALAQRANKQQPDNEAFASTLAWIYVKNKLPDPAISILKPLVQRNPSRANYRYRLAMALFIKGDRTEARRECEEALRSASDLDETTSIRELMSRIGQLKT